MHACIAAIGILFHSIPLGVLRVYNTDTVGATGAIMIMFAEWNFEGGGLCVYLHKVHKQWPRVDVKRRNQGGRRDFSSSVCMYMYIEFTYLVLYDKVGG